MDKTFKELLDDKRVTAGALANVIGVTRATVHYWAAGEVLPSGENLVKAAQVLGVSPSMVFDCCLQSRRKKKKEEEKK